MRADSLNLASGVQTEDGFHVFALLHAFEGLFPVFEGVDAADYRGQVHLPGGEQGQDALPRGVEVAEGALEGYGFADQRVEAEIEGLRAPADLGDAAVGAYQLQGLLQCFADAGGIDDQVGAEAVAQ